MAREGLAFEIAQCNFIGKIKNESILKEGIQIKSNGREIFDVTFQINSADQYGWPFTFLVQLKNKNFLVRNHPKSIFYGKKLIPCTRTKKRSIRRKSFASTEDMQSITGDIWKPPMKNCKCQWRIGKQQWRECKVLERKVRNFQEKKNSQSNQRRNSSL